jgi:uncharacterized lipoprotein YmbA
MTTDRRHVLRLLGAAPLLAVSAGTLSGCLSANPNYYRLGMVPGPVVRGAPPSVEVRNMSIPGYLDRQGIVKRAGDFKLDIHTNDIWAEPLADMLQATMVQDLSQRLMGTTVIAAGGSIGANYDMLIETNILRFDPDPNGMMVLTAQVALRDGVSLQIVATTTIQHQAPANAPVVANIVASMSGLWGQAADDVSTLLAQTWATHPRTSG